MDEDGGRLVCGDELFTVADDDVGDTNGLSEDSCEIGLVVGGGEQEEKSNSNDFVGDGTS